MLPRFYNHALLHFRSVEVESEDVGEGCVGEKHPHVRAQGVAQALCPRVRKEGGKHGV